MRIVIVGGGIIGCTVAYTLLKRGAESSRSLHVTLIERNNALGQESSRAAAGILWPRETASTAWSSAVRRSYQLWPKLAHAVMDETGQDICFRQTGSLDVEMSLDHAQGGASVSFLSTHHEPGGERLILAEALRMEPALSPHIDAVSHYKEAGQVIPSLAVQGVARAAEGRGLEVRLGETVLRLLRDGDTITGVTTQAGDVSADWVVLASGAWSGVFSDGLGVHVPVRPVKGQALSFRLRQPSLRRVVSSSLGYFTPRPTGSVVFGATEEERGFDRVPHAGVVRALLERAERVVPAVADAEFEETWTGLRPGTPDGLPILGRVSGLQGVLLATGHFSTGVLWSPLTAEVIADLVVGEAPPLDLAPFSVHRF